MSCTGWQWQHVRHECDLPMYLALCAHWRRLPPPALALKRLNALVSALAGVPAEPAPDAPSSPARPSPAPSAQSLGSPEAMHSAAMQAAMAGMPVFEGRPADPMLDFIPKPI